MLLKVWNFFFWNRSWKENWIEYFRMVLTPKCEPVLHFWNITEVRNGKLKLVKIRYFYVCWNWICRIIFNFFLSEEFGQIVWKILSNYLRLQIKDEGCVNQTLEWGKWLSKRLIFTIKGSSMMKIAISHSKIITVRQWI